MSSLNLGRSNRGRWQLRRNHLQQRGRLDLMVDGQLLLCSEWSTLLKLSSHFELVLLFSPWQPDSDKREEEKKGGSDGGEVDSEEDGDGRKVEDEDEDRPSFGERTLVSLEENSREEAITPGSFRGFGFKKRSNTGRPKIRQRTSELSWHHHYITMTSPWCHYYIYVCTSSNF